MPPDHQEECHHFHFFSHLRWHAPIQSLPVPSVGRRRLRLSSSKLRSKPSPSVFNSLANHGYLPRDGKELTPQLIRDAIMDVFNVDEGLVERLTRPLPPQLTLADLSVHGFIEHDASLVHDDTYVKRAQRKLIPRWPIMCSLKVWMES
ncbi:hypothetical protein F444_20930 [Phytophthora nicotianae P1976]|uniref:Heme haloperoxidase family profile domain-containing protein n=1 Tax=Phytophthora nicotianae P1976 TaxID=1317066 RepID=A0A080Z2S3_PHYNI|nr:hypothetical protein F444_20930 [Phytophthora nicotianae P1976]